MRAIKRFQAVGHLFGNRIGRPLIGITYPTQDKIHFDFYIVSSGAVILDKELQLIEQKCLSRDTFNRIYADYKGICRVAVQANQKIYSFSKRVPMPIVQEIVESSGEVEGSNHFGLSLETDHEEKVYQICQSIKVKHGEYVDAYQNVRYVDVVAKGLAIQHFIQKDHIWNW